MRNGLHYTSRLDWDFFFQIFLIGFDLYLWLRGKESSLLLIHIHILVNSNFRANKMLSAVMVVKFGHFLSFYQPGLILVKAV